MALVMPNEGFTTMDSTLLKDVLKYLPKARCFDKRLLEPFFLHTPPEYSFVVNESSFYDQFRRYEDVELVEFEVVKEGELAETEVEEEITEGTENSTALPNVSIEKAHNGVIVNSKTFLKDQNWNTLLSLKGLYQCAVCDEFMKPDAVAAHVATETHIGNLDKYAHLKEHERDILRQIEYYNHCGVCNLLTSHINDHVVTETHKQNLMHAINKADEILSKINVDKNEMTDPNDDNNPISEVNGQVINNNGVINETKAESSMNDLNVKDEPNVHKAIGNLAPVVPIPNPSEAIANLNPNDGRRLKLDLEEFPDLTKRNGVVPVNQTTANPNDEKPASDSVETGKSSKLLGNTISYATAAKKTVTPNPEFVFYLHKRHIVKVKYDSWHMILSRRNNTFYCMACTETDIKDKVAHCCGLTHLDNLPKCTIVDAYQDFFVRKVSEKFLHCGQCNNLQYPHLIYDHISLSHPDAKKIKTKTNEKKTPDPIRFEYTADAKNVHVAAARRSATPEPNKIPESVTKHSPNTEKDIKPANIFTSKIQIHPYDLEITLKVLYYNAVFVYAGRFMCGFCECFIMEDLVQHICGTRHTDILREAPFIDKFRNNLLRYVRGNYHCALCNVYIPQDSVYTHIMNEPHTVVLRYASNRRKVGASDPNNRDPPSPKPLANSPTGQSPNMNAVTNVIFDWLQSVPTFERNYINPIIPSHTRILFSGPIPGPILNPYLYHRISGPTMAMQNMAAPSFPKVTVQNSESIDKNECECTKPCIHKQRWNGELPSTMEKRNEKTTSKKAKDKSKKSDGIVKDVKKTKKDSPKKKKSVINEIKRSVDQLKANENMKANDEENDDNNNCKENETKNTFINEEISLIKMDDTMRLRKSFSEVAKMPPKDMASAKRYPITAVTKLPLDKHRVVWDENKIAKEITPSKADNSLKIIDVTLNKKIIFDINKMEYSTCITPNNHWLLKEQRQQSTTYTNKNYSLDNNFTLVTKKSKANELKDTITAFDQAEDDTEDPAFTAVAESKEFNKEKVEITLDDMKMVSELYEPLEQQTDANEKKDATKETSVEKVDKKVTFEDNKQGTKKEKSEANGNEPQSKNKSNAPNKNQDKKPKESNKDNKKKKKEKTPQKTEPVDNEPKDDSKEPAEINDEASTTTEADEVNSDSYDMDEFIYLNLKSFVAKITYSAYNSLVPVGDGTRYCFVCWEQLYGDLKSHVESSKHLENMKSSKYMDHYNDNMIRWKNSTHHCSVCNVIITGSLQTHFSWQHHAATLLETKKTARQITKDMKKTTYRQFRAVTTKKNYTCANPVKLKKSVYDNSFF